MREKERERETQREKERERVNIHLPKFCHVSFPLLTETCELVGLYMLSQLEKLGINIGLYRDDGLATCNKTARETENIKKEICKIFEENKLNITIEANKKLQTSWTLQWTYGQECTNHS